MPAPARSGEIVLIYFCPFPDLHSPVLAVGERLPRFLQLEVPEMDPAVPAGRDNGAPTASVNRVTCSVP